MENPKESLSVSILGEVRAYEHYNGERTLIRYKKNAIHRQNMARILARGLANEPNSIIYRIAFGNGGTFTDAAGNTIFREPNDGRDAGWESRLYNETYSEVVDESDPNFGLDPGSAGPAGTRVGGGSDPTGDPIGGGVTSTEVGTKSNVVTRIFLNENEPSSQLESQSEQPGEFDQCFIFDEIGLYSPGLPALASNGYSQVNVGDKTSEDISNLPVSTNLTLNIDVDGTNYVTQLATPVFGSGPSGEITFGDISEGINTGTWITGGDSIDDFITVFITDKTGGDYPSIVGRKSFGFLTFESKTVGDTSSVELNCNDGMASDFFNVLTNGLCANCNVNQTQGSNAGVINDAQDPDRERERLLTHLVFDPISKTADRTIEIEYTLTVSVMQGQNPQIEVEN